MIMFKLQGNTNCGYNQKISYKILKQKELIKLDKISVYFEKEKYSRI